MNMPYCRPSCYNIFMINWKRFEIEKVEPALSYLVVAILVFSVSFFLVMGIDSTIGFKLPFRIPGIAESVIIIVALGVFSFQWAQTWLEGARQGNIFERHIWQSGAVYVACLVLTLTILFSNFAAPGTLERVILQFYLFTMLFAAGFNAGHLLYIKTKAHEN